MNARVVGCFIFVWFVTDRVLGVLIRIIGDGCRNRILNIGKDDRDKEMGRDDKYRYKDDKYKD